MPLTRRLAALLAAAASLVSCRALADDERSTPEASPQKPEPVFRRFTAKLGTGIGAHLLYDNALYGADLSLALGGNTRSHPGHYHAALGVLVGSTEKGLSIQHFRAGALVEWSIDRLRLGATPEVGYLLIHRTTVDGELGSISVGIALHGSYDLVQFLEDTPPPAALYLSLRGAVDYLVQSKPGTPLLGGGLALGVRF